MTPFAIAGIQMHVSAVHDNIPRFRQKLEVLMHLYPWVQMVIWSELAPYGPFVEKAQTIPGPAEEVFQEMARKHQIWLLPGTLYERREERIFNTLSVINPNGEVIGRYRKMFPFLPYEKGVSQGTEFRSATTCGSPRPPARWPRWAPRSSCTPR
jgi:predicted amidohydrolase